jgi:hypothetical protein
MKQVHRTKRGDFGEIHRYRSRLVGRGSTQIESLDFDEMFASLGNKSLIRVFLASCRENNMVLEQTDVDTALLYGVLDQEINGIT